MNRLTSWWDRRKRARALNKINKLRRLTEPIGTIRQFFYLDAVALRSLYVSRYGPEDARITITNSRTRETEATSSLALTAPKLGTGSVGRYRRSGISASAEIERISSEQSLFRDFLDREAIAGKHRNLLDGASHLSGSNSLDGKAPKRGTLIQVRIKLKADITYQISSFANAVANLTESSPKLQVTGTSDLMQVADMLSQLLIEQAPIDAELTDWKWDPESNSFTSSKNKGELVRLVGLTQVDNYWVDVRRALFDEAECIALIRVSEDIPSDNWSPLKLFDAIRGIPMLEEFDETIRSAIAAFGKTVETKPATNDSIQIALVEYAENRLGSCAPKPISDTISLIASQLSSPSPSASTIADILDSIDELLGLVETLDPCPNTLADLRSRAHSQILMASGTGPVKTSTTETSTPSERLLVGEVIAFYW